jgi:hypothetical protein
VKKIVMISLIGIFTLYFIAGIMATTTYARLPIPCTYKCINHDWYFCCICPGTTWETCGFLQYDCETDPIGYVDVCPPT